MEYKVGDYVRILKKPPAWASELNPNYPGEIKHFPFEGQITQLEYNKRNGYSPAEIGNYGFDMKVLVDNKIIELIGKPNTSKPESYKYLTKLFKKLKIK